MSIVNKILTIRVDEELLDCDFSYPAASIEEAVKAWEGCTPVRWDNGEDVIAKCTDSQTAILCHSAKTLGEYILESEWDLILKLIDSGDFPSCDSEEEFIEKIKGYTYYHALVCSCGGDLEEVNSQLEEDYEEVEESIKK